MHHCKYDPLLSLESVNVSLSAEGHAPNGVPNTHNVEGEMPWKLVRPQPLLVF